MKLQVWSQTLHKTWWCMSVTQRCRQRISHSQALSKFEAILWYIRLYLKQTKPRGEKKERKLTLWLGMMSHSHLLFSLCRRDRDRRLQWGWCQPGLHIIVQEKLSYSVNENLFQKKKKRQGQQDNLAGSQSLVADNSHGGELISPSYLAFTPQINVKTTKLPKTTKKGK